jgi:hypothetical protein
MAQCGVGTSAHPARPLGPGLAAYPGFVLVIARDLADLLAAALLLAGILAFDRQRPVLAAATLTLAGLTRLAVL